MSPNWVAMVGVLGAAPGVGVPSAPTGVVATPGDGRAFLSWVAPSSDGGSPITGYTITPYIGSTPQTPTMVGPALSASIGALANGTAYTFTVFATNAQGNGLASAASNSVTPATVALAITTSPLRAQVWNNTRTVYRGTLGELLNVPILKSTLHGGFHQIELQLQGAADQAVVSAGDICDVIEEKTGNLVFTGIVNDDPRVFDVESTYSIVLDPLVIQLEATPFYHDYTAATEVQQMVRDIVAKVQAGGGHISISDLSVPVTGSTGIFKFDTSYNGLTALEECAKIAGLGWYFFVDETGLLWFQKVDHAKDATHKLAMTTDYVISKRTGPTDSLRNYVEVYGQQPVDSNGNPTGPPTKVISQDAASIAQFGLRALTPAITYPNVTDVATLQQIADTVRQVLAKRVVQYEITMPYFAHSPGQRVSLATPTAATAQLYEPATLPDQPQFRGAGGQIIGSQGSLVVQDVEIDGVTQKLVVGDVPYTLDDLQYIIDQMAARGATSGAPGAPGQPGQQGPPGSGSGGPSVIISGQSDSTSAFTSPTFACDGSSHFFNASSAWIGSASWIDGTGAISKPGLYQFNMALNIIGGITTAGQSALINDATGATQTVPLTNLTGGTISLSGYAMALDATNVSSGFSAGGVEVIVPSDATCTLQLVIWIQRLVHLP